MENTTSPWFFFVFARYVFLSKNVGTVLKFDTARSKYIKVDMVGSARRAATTTSTLGIRTAMVFTIILWK